MASKDKTAALRTQRFERYQNLPESDQRVLELLALIYHPISRSVLADCSNTANISHSMGKRWTTALLKQPVTEWEAIGLVNQSSAGVQCDPLIVELITRELAKSDRFAAYAQITKQKARVMSSALDSVDIVIRFVRIGLYLNQPDQVQEALSRYGYGAVELQDVLRAICFNPFDSDWFLSLDPDIITIVLKLELCDAALNLDPQTELFEILETIVHDRRFPNHGSELLVLLCEQYLLQGRIQEARGVIQVLGTISEAASCLYRGWLALLEGDHSSLAQYDKAIEVALENQPKSKHKSGSLFVPGFGGLFFAFALIRDGSPERLQQALQQANLGATQSDLFIYGYRNLVLAISAQLGDLKARSFLLEMPLFTYQDHNCFDTLISLMARYWVDRDAAAPAALRLLRPIYTNAIEAGYDWIALEAVSLLAELHEDEMFAQLAATMREVGELPEMTLCFQAMQPKSAWELQLLALKALKVDPAAATNAQKSQRMAWAIHLDTWGEVTIEPREQKQNAKGDWSRGRAVSLRRLVKELDSFSYLSDRDRQICQQIEVSRDYNTYYGGGTTYSIPSRVILDLAGHPAVVWRDSPTVGVEIVTGQPQLVVRHNIDETLTIALVPHFSGEQEWVIEQESMTRLKVIGIQPKHRQVAAIFGGAAEIRVPAYAQDQVLAAIEAVAGNMLVQSDIGGVSNIETVPSDPTPHVHLLPASSGLKVLLLARPFRGGGPYYRPGQGGTTAITEIEGLQVQTTRELDAEVMLAQATIAACPTLQRVGGYDNSADEYEWLVSEPIDCLELLTELQALQPSAGEDGEAGEAGETSTTETVCPIIEWPEGEKFRVSRYLHPTDMKISIGRQRDWFAAEGELRVDENTVFDLQQLLRVLEMSPGRFVQLGNGQFAALTKEFRKQLEDLRNFGEEHGDGIRFHPLASLAIEDTLSELGELTADKSWKDHVRRIREMRAVRPDVPSTLQAELRDYQIEGFQWLMQLAHWGVGACLADDMGLGKTLQSLAVILSRASAGPTLVVAPTSVGMNWLSEASKFAPTLNPIWFGSGDRQQTIEQLQARDLVVCSYGLLQQGDVGELLAEVNWTTVILDEAQAIKNAATQRSKAAMKLQADFRLILTGTPIENHLGELWNLFQFINPGLLGSQAKFQQRFITPIERHQDVNVRRQLRTLIQPFILRRTKTQVLSELPSRTEITLPVELSPEEMALYEATRRNALVKLSESDDDQAGARHLRVLAEILRLRRLCCNPRLVVPDTPIPSSKLTVFGEVLEELLENRHKALVFSQFVDHLAIVRDYLDQHQISYQYLDGSTPAKTRKQRVDAFQSGEGDVFLISLKAGGTGLNLTAADYVIHLDPWWNPAVEDQASDRAHRIGQQRPVTIYRLVSCGTIEEKIVDLHQQKRDLADSLLEGTDVSGKLSADQLLAMISSEGS